MSKYSLCKALLLASVILGCHQPLAAEDEQPHEDVLPNIVVVGVRSADVDLVDARNWPTSSATDGAELLRGVNGVSIGRFGGRGLEPVIRGQSQTRVNVLLDGSYVHGGCPNRMDPPTSFASVNSFETVTILKGVQTLRYGGGGSGGTVLFERNAEPEQPGLSGSMAIGASDNELLHDAALGVAYSGEQFYLRGEYENRQAGNYQDGDGDTVRSAWHERSFNIALGLRLRADDRLELGYEKSETTDAYYPGAGMDSPFDEGRHWRLKYRAHDLGVVDRLTVDAYRADVAHVMDNFSNRPLTAPMAARVPSSSDTFGGRFVAEMMFGEVSWTAGLDYQSNERNAIRYMGPTPAMVSMVNSYMWPQVELQQVGVFGEGEFDISEGRSLIAGLRYDYVRAQAGSVEQDPPATALLSPSSLYQIYYGADAGDSADGARLEDNWGGLLRVEQQLDAWTLFAGVSRTMRTADANERYLAANHAMPVNRWVGNPTLDPEEHRQLDLGFVWRSDSQRLDAVVFYDDVADYILRDRARGQTSTLVADSATIYRNVAATIYGVEAEWSWRPTENLRLETAVALVRARNDSDRRDIAQTPPVSGRIGADYSWASWSVGADLRFADKQTRADTSVLTGSGLDARQTPGFGVLDIYFQVPLAGFGNLRFGVNNALDRAYAEHLNRANLDPFSPDPIQVNEPGRAVWARYQMDF